MGALDDEGLDREGELPREVIAGHDFGLLYGVLVDRVASGDEAGDFGGRRIDRFGGDRQRDVLSLRERQFKPARAEGVAVAGLAASCFDGMSDAVAPFRLRMIRAAIREDAEMAVNGRREFESGLVGDPARVRVEMVLGAGVVMRLAVEASILNVDPDGERHVAFRGEILAEGHRGVGPFEMQHCRVLAVQQVCGEDDFDGTIVAGAGDEAPPRRRAGDELDKVVGVERSDEAVGADPHTRAFGEDVAVDRNARVQIRAEQAVVLGLDAPEVNAQTRHATAVVGEENDGIWAENCGGRRCDR